MISKPPVEIRAWVWMQRALGRNADPPALFLPRAIADCIVATTAGAMGCLLVAASADAQCVNKVTNQPAPCPGRPATPPTTAGLGSTMVLVGPAVPTPPVLKLCRAAWTGAPRVCRVIAIPMPPLPPLSPNQVGDTPAPPPGYGPPR